jgi:putative ABC transport system permease protein
MIRNYLTIALRNFARNKNYTFVNILGLSIGITSCVILFLLILHDLSFDKFHSKHEHLFRVVRTDKSASGIQYDPVTPYPFGNAFRQDFPEVPLMTQFHYHSEGFVTVKADKRQVESVLFADSLFFKVFDFGIVAGNPAKDLGEPNKVFLTEKLSAALNCGVGEKIKLDNKLELEVVGLLQDVPANSHIQYSMVVSMPSFTKEFFEWPVDHWGLNSAGFSYLVLPPSVSEESILTRLEKLVKKYYSKEEAARTTYLLQRFDDIHFNTTYASTPGQVNNVDTTNLLIMGVLGAFILIIACINYVNLATALAIRKSKEIGIRKTLGARRSQLTVYFLSETFLLTLAAIIISLGLVEWTLPWLRMFLEKEIHMNLFTNPYLIFFLVALLIIATILSGFYPAIILSGFDPVAVLKNKINARGSSGATIRRMLVIFQFVIAQMMIIATLVISDQMDYFRSKPLGFSKEAIVNIALPKNDVDLLKNFRTRLEANSSISNVSFAVGAPTSESNIGTGYFLEEKGPDESYTVTVKTVDIHYKDTYGLKLKAGRWFEESEEKMAYDTTLGSKERYSIVINEAAARKAGFKTTEEIIGKRIHIGLNDITAPVVGVTEDFHVSSLRQEINPVVMIILPGLYYDAGISISTANMTETIDFIRKTWTDLFPEYYFQYEFLDEHLRNLYAEEHRELVLFRIFSGIAIFIGCLGLLGLVSFMANQKLKEIGVRKVFGASVPSIVMIFSKEFVRLVLIAFLIATPLSWYLMNEWLQNFEYHVSIHWSVFLIGLLVTVLIAIATVAYRSLRAGMANPVDSLRSE